MSIASFIPPVLYARGYIVKLEDSLSKDDNKPWMTRLTLETEDHGELRVDVMYEDIARNEIYSHNSAAYPVELKLQLGLPRVNGGKGYNNIHCVKIVPIEQPAAKSA